MPSRREEEWLNQLRQEAEPTAAWARRWNIAPADPAEIALGRATYSGTFAGWVRPGWIPLLDRLARDLVALGWNRSLFQVRQRMGELRVCVGEQDPALAAGACEAIHHRIDEATAESVKTCEECGEPGRLADVGRGWMMTLCPRHFEAESAQRRVWAAKWPWRPPRRN